MHLLHPLSAAGWLTMAETTVLTTTAARTTTDDRLGAAINGALAMTSRAGDCRQSSRSAHMGRQDPSYQLVFALPSSSPTPTTPS